MRQDDKVFVDKSGRFSVVLTAGVAERMLAECRRAGMKETGGVLAGSYSADRRTAVITHLSGLPCDSKSGRSTLLRGIKGIKEWLFSLWERRVAYYLGEWHYHPGGSPSPSGRDAKQMAEIASSKECNCPEAVLVIVGGGPSEQFDFSATVYETTGTTHSLHLKRRSTE